MSGKLRVARGNGKRVRKAYYAEVSVGSNDGGLTITTTHTDDGGEWINLSLDREATASLLGLIEIALRHDATANFGLKAINRAFALGKLKDTQPDKVTRKEVR